MNCPHCGCDVSVTEKIYEWRILSEYSFSCFGCTAVTIFWAQNQPKAEMMYERRVISKCEIELQKETVKALKDEA